MMRNSSFTQALNKLLISLFVGLAFFFGVPTTEAASTINYQGILKTSSQTAVPDTSYTFIFKLYTQSSGGSAVWTETQSLTTSNGVFSAELGRASSFPSNLFSSNPTMYLGITVNSDSEMIPRQRVGSLPYAFTADEISLSGLRAAAQTNTINNLNFAQNWNWNTLTTEDALTISSSTQTTGTLLSILTNSNNLDSSKGLLSVINSGTSTNGIVARIQSNGSDTQSGITILANGNVGLGKSNPAYLFDISKTNTIPALDITRVARLNYNVSGITNDTTAQGTRSLEVNTTVTGPYSMGTLSSLYANTYNDSTAGTTTHLIGVVGRAYNRGGGTATQAMGTYGGINTSGAGGNILQGYGLYANSPIMTGGSIRDYFGVASEFSSSQISGGTIQNAYGAYFAVPSGATNNNIGLIIGGAPSGVNNLALFATGNSVLNGKLDIAGQLTPQGGVFLNNFNLVYNGSLQVKNKAGADWLNFASRNTSGSEAVVNFSNIGSITASLISAQSLGIKNASPSYLLHVGDGTTSGIIARFQNSTGTCDINPTATALSCSSDETLKENIVSINESSLEKIKQLNPVTYSWKDDENHNTQTGFIAQQVQSIFPNLVSEEKDTHLLSLNYIGFIPYIIKSMQEIITKIDFFAEKFITKKAYIEELCIGTAQEATCLSKTQIDTLLNNVRQQIIEPTPMTSEAEPTQEESETIESLVLEKEKVVEEKTPTPQEENEESEEQPKENSQPTYTPITEDSGNELL
ncbi:tail fiber domain-containing protein [Emticicia sp. BO119]|uniref:tail fiber domain-containing protein n=1 Tax=Emticicia sp. BO119 TaxID=2757768 RepID=UPI0015F0BCF6|nr:tail fiber domain-containing protein [Emticicia sp. BO119]MBA4850512.1 tail fiber domain-containing protein [Emticicia sp. BO119]